jgi:hypothetical protein
MAGSGITARMAECLDVIASCRLALRSINRIQIGAI